MADELSHFLKLRLDVYEKSMHVMAKDLHYVYHKQDSLGIRSEKFVEDLKQFASNETDGLRKKLTDAAQCLLDKEDARVRLYDRYEFNVVPKLEQVPVHVKECHDSVKTRDAVVKKLLKKKAALAKAKGKPGSDRGKITALTREIHDVSVTMSDNNNRVMSSVEKCEAIKLQNLKAMFLELAHAEITYHAKALESLTDFANIINSINDGAEVQAVLEKAQLTQQLGQKGNVTTTASGNNNNNNNSNSNSNNNNNNNNNNGANPPSPGQMPDPSRGAYGSSSGYNNNNNNNNNNNYDRDRAGNNENQDYNGNNGNNNGSNNGYNSNNNNYNSNNNNYNSNRDGGNGNNYNNNNNNNNNGGGGGGGGGNGYNSSNRGGGAGSSDGRYNNNENSGGRYDGNNEGSARTPRSDYAGASSEVQNFRDPSPRGNNNIQTAW